MKTRSISHSVITVLSCCAITLLGGWIGSHPSSPTTLKDSHLHRTGTADSSKWDSTGWSGRVVVGEFATGINCLFCQTRDQAFDTLMQRYPSTVFIPLSYHYALNVPISNPADSTTKRWAAWWGWGPDEETKGKYGVFHYTLDPKESWTWHVFFDGRAIKRGEEQSWQIKEREAYIDSELRRAPEAVLHVEASPHGGTIVAKVQVTSISKPHSDVYLRMVVIEDTVMLNGTDTAEFNKRDATWQNRLNHYMVVRAAAGDDKYPLGILMHGTGTVSYTFNMAKTQEQRLRIRSLALGKLQPKTAKDSSDVNSLTLEHTAAFSGKENWVMDPKRLHVVAFLQDVNSGDVLQAQMIHVNTGPHGELLKLP